jgi:hypothetical protein
MKKFFNYLLLIIVALIVLAIVFGVDLNSAHIENAQVCTELSGDLCGNDQMSFDANSPQIVVSCELKNPPTDTKVEFTWNYLSNGITKIDAVTLSSGEHIGTVNMHSSLSRPNNGWPSGDYEVVIKILDTEKEPVIKKFYVR